MCQYNHTLYSQLILWVLSSYRNKRLLGTTAQSTLFGLGLYDFYILSLKLCPDFEPLRLSWALARLACCSGCPDQAHWSLTYINTCIVRDKSVLHSNLFYSGTGNHRSIKYNSSVVARRTWTFPWWRCLHLLENYFILFYYSCHYGKSPSWKVCDCIYECRRE